MVCVCVGMNASGLTSDGLVVWTGLVERWVRLGWAGWAGPWWATPPTPPPPQRRVGAVAAMLVSALLARCPLPGQRYGAGARLARRVLSIGGRERGRGLPLSFSLFLSLSVTPSVLGKERVNARGRAGQTCSTLEWHRSAWRARFFLRFLREISPAASRYTGAECDGGGGMGAMPETRKTLGVMENRHRVPKTPLRSPVPPARWASPQKSQAPPVASR